MTHIDDQAADRGGRRDDDDAPDVIRRQSIEHAQRVRAVLLATRKPRPRYAVLCSVCGREHPVATPRPVTQPLCADCHADLQRAAEREH